MEDEDYTESKGKNSHAKKNSFSKCN